MRPSSSAHSTGGSWLQSVQKPNTLSSPGQQAHQLTQPASHSLHDIYLLRSSSPIPSVSIPVIVGVCNVGSSELTSSCGSSPVARLAVDAGYIDRSNMSNSLTSLERSIGLTPNAYALASYVLPSDEPTLPHTGLLTSGNVRLGPSAAVPCRTGLCSPSRSCW